MNHILQKRLPNLKKNKIKISIIANIGTFVLHFNLSRKFELNKSYYKIFKRALHLK